MANPSCLIGISQHLTIDSVISRIKKGDFLELSSRREVLTFWNKHPTLRLAWHFVRVEDETC